VLRPGGLLPGAAITRFASTLDGVAQAFLLEPGFEAIVERDLADGQHRNPDGHPGWFTTAYLPPPGNPTERASDMRCGSSFLGTHGETGQCFARTVLAGCRQGRRDAPQITRP
jgi:hypothetical protein